MTYMEMKAIGNKIADARKKLGVSQAQLAEQLFISPQAVGKWERGESIPDLLTFNRLAKLLGVDLNYFSEDFPSLATEQVVEHEQAIPASSLEETFDGPRWDMSRGNWADADFSGLKGLHDKFSASNMQNCKFIGSDLSGLLLKGNNVEQCDFSQSDFGKSRIQNAYLSKNTFIDCSLKRAEFSGSHISGCDFSKADFTHAVIKTGGLEKSILNQAIFRHTSFLETYLADLVFEGAVENCAFENCKFSRVTFQNVTLTNTFFKCKSLKRIRFVDCKADRMTYAFLQNGKADLSGVELMTSMTR